MRRISAVGAAIAVAGFLAVGVPTVANAASCHFYAFNPWTKASSWSIHGSAYGVKKSRVCKRAKRRCLKRLRRAWNKGEFQSYRCEKMVQAQ